MNNKGFSLVEAIVAFAIAAIAGVAVFGMMSSSNNFFKRTNTDVGLQYEQQIVVNKLIDTIVESSGAVNYDPTGKALIVYNKIDNGPQSKDAVLHNYSYEASRIKFEKEDADDEVGQLVYYRKTFGSIDDIDASDLDDDDDEGVVKGLLGEEVKDISFDLNEIEKGRISFTIVFVSDKKEVKSTQLVSLRNNVEVSEDPTKVFTEDNDFLNSFIKSITIYRDGTPFDQGSQDEILKVSTGPVSAQYTAIVTPINEMLSDREYGVLWSLQNQVEGMSVNETTGLVSVESTVADDTVNVLVATSIDDPNKKQTLNIIVKGNGVYPELLELFGSEYTDTPTTRTYKVYPEITYTDGTKSTDGNKCNWTIDKLPEGCSFDPSTNEFFVTSAANDQSYKFTATVKQASKDGTRLKASITINVKDVGKYEAKQQLGLSGKQSRYNNRGSSTRVQTSWSNGSLTDFTYEWTIEPFGENWNEGDYTRNFDKMISIKGATGRKVSTTRNVRNLEIECDMDLDWSNSYSVKVKCTAYDSKGRKYGNGNEKEGNYQGPVEFIVTYEPVKVVLTVANSYAENSERTYYFNTDRELKFSTDGTKDKDGYYLANGDIYGGNTVRYYEIAARGLNYDSVKNSVKVELVKDKCHFYNNLVSYEVKDSDSLSNKIVPLNAEAKTLIGTSDFANSGGRAIGFYLKMSNTQFKEYFDNEVKKVSYIAPYFQCSTSYNSAECYITESSNYYSDVNITLSSNYRYKIVYDDTKLNDKNYVEYVYTVNGKPNSEDEDGE